MNKGECEGLCSFSDGWIFPEGKDGILIDLAFDQHPLAMHVTCAALQYSTIQKMLLHDVEVSGQPRPISRGLAQLVDTYYLYRTHKIEHPIESATLSLIS